MPATGYIQVHAFASRAQLPLKNTAILLTSEDGTPIAMRLTDRSGLIEPIPIPVPDRSGSQRPDPDEVPYASVTIYAYKPGYEQIINEDVQIFADVTTYQDLEMIPLSELPESFGETEVFQTPPQDL